MSIKEAIALYKEKGFTALSSEAIAMLKSNLDLVDDDVKEDLEGEIKEAERLDEATGDLKKVFNEVIDAKLKEFEEKTDANVKEFLKQERELIAKGVGLYKEDIKAQRKEANERLRGICKAFASKNMPEKLKEMTTDATGTPYAGYVVDSELNAEIQHLIEEYGVARQEMTVMTLSKGSYKTNELVTDITVYWVSEGSAISSSQVVLDQNTLELQKLAVIVSMTRELIEDEEIDLMNFVGRRVAENFAEAEDEFVFNGDGSSTYGGFTGLLKSTAVNSVVMTGTTFASVDFDDLQDMITATPEASRRGGKFYMHYSIWAMLRKLKKNSEDNNYAFGDPSVAGPATIFDKPVVFVEVMPEATEIAANTAFIIFGNLRQGCIFGQKGEMIVDEFTSGTIRNVANNADINILTTDRTAVRFIERVGYFQIITQFRKPVTVLKTAQASA
jgi:HK97 family phage major capsid protein